MRFYGGFLRFMTAQEPIFFGHWRHMLDIARQHSSSDYKRDADRLASHSASIILSRTCLEIFFNELYFLQIHEGVLSSSAMFHSRARQKQLKLTYRNFVNLHICERLEVTYPNASETLIDDVSLQNQIRNYCIHYTASDVKQQLANDFKQHPSFKDNDLHSQTSPQEVYINDVTAKWCNEVTLKTVIAVEEAQTPAHANSELNIEHCMEMLS